MTLSSKQHIKSLDGWRGVAILLVFFFHYLPRTGHNPLSMLASVGWWGVDLFFVLSGFLITGILFDTRAASGFFKAFYVRRALRLFPVYCLAILVVALGTGFFQHYRSWLLLPFFVYGANIVLALPHGFPDLTPFRCDHFWSLAVEEQFYSIWPLIVFFVTDRRKLMRICCGGIVLALLLRIGLVVFGGHTWIAYRELPARMDSLLAGSLIALAARGPEAARWLSPRLVRWTLAAACASLVPVLVSAHTLFFISKPMASVGYTLIAVLSACILSLSLIPGTLTQRVGSNALLRFFGRYSYGLYIWHYLPLKIFTPWDESFRHVIHPVILADIVYALAMLALFTIWALVSYHGFEAFFLKMKSRFVASQVMAPRETGSQSEVTAVGAQTV